MHYAGIYATNRLFNKNNFMKEKHLRVMQEGYNMNIQYNQKYMFCKGRVIDSVFNCAEDTHKGVHGINCYLENESNALKGVRTSI